MPDHSETTIATEFIIGLYKSYGDDLIKVRRELGNLYTSRCMPWASRSLLHKVAARLVRPVAGPVGVEPLMLAQGDDETCEILYLLVREFGPEQVVEISPFHGWSTCWLLSALRDNGHGNLVSFDLLDVATKNVPKELSADRWRLVVGDAKGQVANLPESIDFLLMDSDHSAEFAHWYIKNVFPNVRATAPVCVDDVFHTADPSGFDGEGGVITDWLRDCSTEFFTCAKAKNPSALNAIRGQKVGMGISRRIHTSDANPSIFFRMPIAT